MNRSLFNIIGYPFWEGACKQGSELAPQFLIESVAAIYGYAAFPDLYLQRPASHFDNIINSPYNAKYLQMIIDANITLRGRSYSTLCQNQIPIVIGGDHSLGLGSVAASAQYDSNVGVIWFDAHGDMNTEATSPTGHIHGMPLAALMGLCESELNNVPVHYVKPQNIFWIGTRSLDAGEQHLIEKLHLNVYSTDDVHRRGMTAIMAEIATKMQSLGISNVHCSFDIDAMDPAIVAATGCLVPDGLNNTDFDIFVQSIASLQQHIIALDFVEYNPLLDDSRKTSLDWCRHALAQLCNAVVKNNR